MCLLRTFFLAAFVASLIANGQEEKRASVNQVLRIAETIVSTGKLLKVKRQVYPNYLATELAKEAYTWENRSRAKRRVYGNPVAIELAKGGYRWGKLSRIKRQVYGNPAAIGLAKKAYKWEQLSRVKRQVYGNQAAVQLAKKAYEWEKISRRERQVSGNPASIELAEEASGNKWEQITRMESNHRPFNLTIERIKSQIYGNTAAEYNWERPPRVKRRVVFASSPALKLGDSANRLEWGGNAHKWRRRFRGKRRKRQVVGSNLESEKLSREARRWEKESLRWRKLTGDAKTGVYSNPTASKLARKAVKWEMLLRGKRRARKSPKKHK